MSLLWTSPPASLFFGSCFLSFRVINAYSTNSVDHRVHSVPPDVLFPDLGIPLLVVGDLNIYNPTSDPLRSFSSTEISSSTPYFEMAVEAGFALLNSPEEYTRFPLVGSAGPPVIDLAFANPLFLPAVRSWEASLRSTGSDHIPITITLASPSPIPKPLHPRWADTDWETLTPILKACIVPPPLLYVIPHSSWMNGYPSRSVASPLSSKSIPRCPDRPTTPNPGGPLT